MNSRNQLITRHSMPLVALGAYKLTGDPTRFKESYTANHPLPPPSVAPPFYLPVFSRLLRFAMSTSRKPRLHRGLLRLERTAISTPPPPPCCPSLISCPLRFPMSTPRTDMSTSRIAMTTPRIAMSTPRNAQAASRFRQRPPYNDFLRRGPRLFASPHWVCHRSPRPLAPTHSWLGE